MVYSSILHLQALMRHFLCSISYNWHQQSWLVLLAWFILWHMLCTARYITTLCVTIHHSFCATQLAPYLILLCSLYCCSAHLSVYWNNNSLHQYQETFRQWSCQCESSNFQCLLQVCCSHSFYTFHVVFLNTCRPYKVSTTHTFKPEFAVSGRNLLGLTIQCG
jgi:hypothetical protein